MFPGIGTCLVGWFGQEGRFGQFGQEGIGDGLAGQLVVGGAKAAKLFVERPGMGRARVFYSRGEGPLAMWRRRISKTQAGITENNLGVPVTHIKGGILFKHARVAEVFTPRRGEYSIVWKPLETMVRKRAGTVAFAGQRLLDVTEADIAAKGRWGG